MARSREFREAARAQGEALESLREARRPWAPRQTRAVEARVAEVEAEREHM